MSAKAALETAGSVMFTLDKYLNDEERVMHHHRMQKMYNALKVLRSIAERAGDVEGIRNAHIGKGFVAGYEAVSSWLLNGEGKDGGGYG